LFFIFLYSSFEFYSIPCFSPKITTSKLSTAVLLSDMADNSAEVQKAQRFMRTFHDELGEKANEIIRVRFPQKVQSLRVLPNLVFVDGKYRKAQAPSASSVDHSNGAEPPAKRARTEGNSSSAADSLYLHVSSNKEILEMMDALKGEIFELVEMVSVVRMWIELNKPRIETGGNFDVGIQEETVSELARAEDSALAVLDSMTKYTLTRAKIASKLAKYGNAVQDYVQSIMLLDEKQCCDLSICSSDLRNNYAILYDLCTKNMERLQKPREAMLPNIF
jgi:proteasome activator subunit 3 (PA28 gamma)